MPDGLRFKKLVRSELKFGVPKVEILLEVDSLKGNNINSLG